MGRNKLRKSILMIVTATVVAGNLVYADGAKNCITDLKLNNDGRNVKVDIYTNKPYSEPVVVNKREGNKYVILIPETVSTVKSMPKVSGAGNVSVNMQTVNAGKGYTKITITSDKVVNVIPKTITSAGGAAAKPQTATATKPQQTKPASTTKSTASASKPTTAQKAKPVKTSQKPTVAAVKQKPKATPKPATAQKPKNNTVQKPVTPAQKPKVATTTVKPKVVSEPVKPVQTASKPPVSNNVEPINKPLQILEQEVIADKSSDIRVHVSDGLLEKTIKENDEIIKQRKLMRLKRKGKNVKKPVDDRKMSVGESIKLVLDNMRTISLWKLLLLAGAITFPIIVIMIILNLDKRVNKRIGAMKKEDDVVIMERALRENVNAVRAQKAAQQASEQFVDDSSNEYNSFDDMLDKVEDSTILQETYSASVVDVDDAVNEPVPSVDSSDFELDEAVVEDIVDETLSSHDFGFGEGGSEISELADRESVSLDEFSRGNLVDSAFDEGDLRTEVVPYNPDGVLADYSNVNDQEFFDELVLQSFAENDVECLPENTPSDEIFEYMTSQDTGVMLADFEHSHFEQEQDEEEPVETEPSSGDVTMLTEAKINDRTGLYLVNYDNYSSLVGHISDDYFVLKTFDGLVNGNISLKPTEKSKDSMRYLVRVGRNKMIVEVNDYSMSRLIDL